MWLQGIFHQGGGNEAVAGHFVKRVRSLLVNVVQLEWADWGHDIIPIALAKEYAHVQEALWEEELAAIERAEREEAEEMVCKEAEWEQVEREEAARMQAERE